jgi:hypothetical protein
MDPLWLLRGDRMKPGWQKLEKESKEKKTDVVVFDRGSGWALICGPNEPTGYEGMVLAELKTGMYVSEQGYPVYIVEGTEVRWPEEVIKALGGEAVKLFQEIDDAVTVLQRLGMAY